MGTITLCYVEQHHLVQIDACFPVFNTALSGSILEDKLFMPICVYFCFVLLIYGHKEHQRQFAPMEKEIKCSFLLPATRASALRIVLAFAVLKYSSAATHSLFETSLFCMCF